MWLITPKRIKQSNRPKVAKLIKAARRMVRTFHAYNPSVRPGVRVVWRGYGYIARCQYVDRFTGAACTFNIAFEGDI